MFITIAFSSIGGGFFPNLLLEVVWNVDSIIISLFSPRVTCNIYSSCLMMLKGFKGCGFSYLLPFYGCHGVGPVYKVQSLPQNHWSFDSHFFSHIHLSFA